MIDFAQTPEGDLDLTAGDLVLCESTEQHKADILLASQGDISDAPLIGGGIIDFMYSNEYDLMLRSLAGALERDGIRVRRVGYDAQGQLQIEGEYETNNN